MIHFPRHVQSNPVVAVNFHFFADPPDISVSLPNLILQCAGAGAVRLTRSSPSTASLNHLGATNPVPGTVRRCVEDPGDSTPSKSGARVVDTAFLTATTSTKARTRTTRTKTKTRTRRMLRVPCANYHQGSLQTPSSAVFTGA